MLDEPQIFADGVCEKNAAFSFHHDRDGCVTLEPILHFREWDKR